MIINKTLSYGLKALKVSTWASVVFAVVMVTVVGFFVAFPVLLKAPLEQQLSGISGQTVKLSKMSFGFDSGEIALHAWQYLRDCSKATS